MCGFFVSVSIRFCLFFDFLFAVCLLLFPRNGCCNQWRNRYPQDNENRSSNNSCERSLQMHATTSRIAEQILIAFNHQYHCQTPPDETRDKASNGVHGIIYPRRISRLPGLRQESEYECTVRQ